MKILDTIKAKVLRQVGNPGLLVVHDDRDYPNEQFGAGFKNYQPKHESISYYRYHYNQNPQNICTQVATALALSEQMSVRWSVKPITRLLKKLGKISGNGFCSQRPPMGVTVDHGLIPHHNMPDENVANWNQFSKWDKETQELYERVAPMYKMTEYTKLRNEQAVFEALDSGFVPIVASKWYSAMNSPKSPNFFLNFSGYYIGGHQYRITGYRKSGADFEDGQSFGANYGKKGKAFNETLFGSGYYEVFIVSYNGSPLLPIEVLRPLFLLQHEGLLVKAHDWENESKCYIIENGKRRHVRGDDEMKTFFHLQNKLGLTRVNKMVLNSVEEGEPYPFIV